MTGPTWPTLVAWCAVMSMVAFLAYGLDKAAAKEGRRRRPERTLHFISLAGGWPGALIGQRVFRHKTRKQPFRTIFWGTVVANLVVVTWLLGRM